MSIASEISRLQGAKADLKTAIEGKGVTVPSATKLDGYADLVDAIQQGGGGSTLITKSISANGTYNASSDNADGYSQVTVAVPNTYTAGDEGKVVSSGALVSQTAHADVTPTTSDQTIDTTTNNSIKVKGDADLVASNIKKDVEIFGITGSYEGSGGGGFVEVASGTYTGSGTAQSDFVIGSKMAQTDFLVVITADPNSVFANDTYYKYAGFAGVVLSEFCHFDLSTVGANKNPISDISYEVDGSPVNVGAYALDVFNIRQTSGQQTRARFQISRNNNATFSLRADVSNSVYLSVSTITFNYKVLYFGNNPSVDIVDLS